MALNPTIDYNEEHDIMVRLKNSTPGERAQAILLLALIRAVDRLVDAVRNQCR